MLVEAGFLAAITAAGFYAIYKKLPRNVRRFMEKHPLFTDLFVLMLTYGFLGFTLMAHMAGGMIVLLVSCMLYVSEHHDDFLYIFDMMTAIQVKLNELKKYFN